jgi:hypothetical protein
MVIVQLRHSERTDKMPTHPAISDVRKKIGRNQTTLHVNDSRKPLREMLRRCCYPCCDEIGAPAPDK